MTSLPFAGVKYAGAVATLIESMHIHIYEICTGYFKSIATYIFFTYFWEDFQKISVTKGEPGVIII